MRKALLIAGIALLGWYASFTWLPAIYARGRLSGRIDSRCSYDLMRASIEREAGRLGRQDDRAARSRVIQTDGALLLWDTPAGRFWIPRGDSMELARKLAGRLVDVRWGWIESTGEVPVRPGDVFIDVGAHVGQSALAALKMGASKVVSIEPDPENVECMRRNLAGAVQSGQVLIEPIGLWDTPDTLPIIRRAESSQSGVGPGGDATVRVPLEPLDAVVRRLGLTRVDVIKMDFDDGERHAIRGAAETIRRFKPRIVVGTYHPDGDLEGVLAEVEAIRRDYAIAPNRCLPFGHRVFPDQLYFH